MTIGDLIVRVGAQIDGFKSAMAEVSSSLNATATKMASVGTAMTAAVTLPLVGVGIAALKTAGELEQNTIAFKTLMGSATAAQKHLEDLRAFAAKTPFQFTELTLASKRMQALGFDAKSVIPILTNVGDAAAALGMGAEGMQRIITALGQMKAKGMVQAEEMRQLAEAGIPAWQILAKTLNTDVAGAMKMVEQRTVEAATAIPAILAGMNEKFGGLMAQQNKTLLGQWSDLKDQITFTLTDIGTALMPIAKSMFENVMKPVLAGIKDLAGGFASLPDPVKNAALGLVGFAAVVGPTMFVIGKLITLCGDFQLVITKTLIPSIVSLANVVAGLGATQLSMLATQFGGVGVGYTTMLATGVLRVAGWVALAAAVWELVNAYRGMKDAQEGMERSTKLQQDSLLKLEISLKRQGADITELQKQYASGAITWTQYMQKLRDVSAELFKSNQAHQENATAVTKALTATGAYQVKLQGLRQDVENARKALDDATVKFQEHKNTANDVGRAYDAWKAATETLEGAQEALLPVVTNVHKATREFVDISGRTLPDAQKQAANMVAALNVKLADQYQELNNAQKLLDQAIERWEKYHDNTVEVEKALAALEQAQASLNKELGKIPEVDEVMKRWLEINDQAVEAFRKIPPAISAIPPFVRTLEIDLYDLGLRARDAAGEITTKLIAAFEDLATKQAPTLEEAHLAWSKVSSDINRLARYDLPAALKLYGDYEAMLGRLGAPEGEMLALRKARLDLEVQIAEQTGASATAQIIGIQNIRIAQQALYDKTHLLGDLYVNVTNDIMRGFGEIGKSVADVIVDGGKLGDKFIEIGKKIAKSLIEDVVGTAFKALKTAILESTGLMGKLTGALTGALGGGGSAASTAASGASTAAGGASSAAGGAASSIGSFANVFNMVTGAVSAIAGVFNAIGTMRLEGTMNAVEHNTRYLQIQFEQYLAEHYLAKDQLFLKLDDMWNEIRNVVSAVRDIAMPQMQMAGGGGNTFTFYVQASDPKAVVEEVAAYLKAQGVYV